MTAVATVLSARDLCAFDQMTMLAATTKYLMVGSLFDGSGRSHQLCIPEDPAEPGQNR